MKKFFETLNRLAHPGRPDIIEKDYHLHRLMDRISRNIYLRENLVFKGGTCLVKAYMGYYRFSEDLDFAWKDTSIWEDKTPSQTRRDCSREIDRLLEIFCGISEELGLKFNGDKSDRNEVNIGGGGRMPKFFLGYHSEILGQPSSIKIEINFVDMIVYPFQQRNLQSYMEDFESDEIAFLYNVPYREYTKPVMVECYDPREFYIEKCRAIMTRIAYKLRDAVDIYMLQQRYGYTIQQHKEEIMNKTRFMLDLYNKYKENIQIAAIPPLETTYNGELKLLTIPTPKDLRENIEMIHRQIQEIQTELVMGGRNL